MTWLAEHPWVLISLMALGLPLGMGAQRLRDRRKAARAHREQDAAELVVDSRWQAAQTELDNMMREAFLSAQAEARRDRIMSAKACGCEACHVFLAEQKVNAS